MPLEGDYQPSPHRFVADQVRLYEESGGKEGTELEGRPCVILSTKGRKSDKIRKTPLMRVKKGDRYAVVASMGGAPAHPIWYLNLVADPSVSLQDGPDVQDYTASTASPDEKAEWWPIATAVWPPYDDYQAKTERDIPLVILEPVD